jgi:hypothetical protein
MWGSSSVFLTKPLEPAELFGSSPAKPAFSDSLLGDSWGGLVCGGIHVSGTKDLDR